MFTSLTHCQHITPVGIELINHYETKNGKPDLIVYRCPAGVPTAGRGHADYSLKVGSRITLAQADMWFKQDIARFEDHVNKNSKRTLFWHERDALYSLCFNAGYRMKGALRDAVNYGNPKQATYYIRQICKAKVNGVLKILPGLVKRRATECKLYAEGVLQFQ